MAEYTFMEEEMASRNHCITQLRLGAHLYLLGETYVAGSELSLDMSVPERQKILEKYGLGAVRELKPDLVLYRAEDFAFIKTSKGEDEVRTMAIPLLCVEIISPAQSTSEILRKLRVYFELGVKSCWYVDPTLEIVVIYNEFLEKKIYDTDLVDNNLGIKIPLSKVFY